MPVGLSFLGLEDVEGLLELEGVVVAEGSLFLCSLKFEDVEVLLVFLPLETVALVEYARVPWGNREAEEGLG